MMRFSYEIVHVPGTQLIVADALSRAPSKPPPPTLDQFQFQQDIYLFIQSNVKGFPVSDKKTRTNQKSSERRLHISTDSTVFLY